MNEPLVPRATLELWWDALVRGDGYDREGNQYDLLTDGAHAYRTAQQYRAHLAAVTKERDALTGVPHD